MLFLYIILGIFIFCIFTFIINFLYQVHYCKKNGMHLAKVAKGDKVLTKFKRIFILFPRQLVKDMYSRQDYEFTENGFHLFVGEQGSGKTVTLVYMLQKMKKKYPKMKIRTNMAYAYEDGCIASWKDLVFENNGILGQIDVIDECQLWFNSLQSKDMPIEMFQEISQQRKQRKCIYGTAQVWNRVAKPIREQVNFVYKPITLFGCLTICIKYKPSVDDTGSIDKLKFRSMFFFIHSDLIRDSFDTYQRIQSQSLEGYKPFSEQLNSTTASAGACGGNVLVGEIINK